MPQPGALTSTKKQAYPSFGLTKFWLSNLTDEITPTHQSLVHQHISCGPTRLSTVLAFFSLNLSGLNIVFVEAPEQFSSGGGVVFFKTC